MTIEQIDSGRVIILLGSEDMRDFSLEYGKLGFSDPHSKKILRRLLSLACTKTGICTDNKRMFVEAVPHDSGCLILLTVSPRTQRRKYRIKRSSRCVCALFEDVEALISACAEMSRRIPGFKSSVYLCGDGYRLISDEAPVSLYTLALLGEFSKPCVCSRVAAARIAENGKLIANGNAATVIGKHFIE